MYVYVTGCVVFSSFATELRCHNVSHEAHLCCLSAPSQGIFLPINSPFPPQASSAGARAAP